MDLGSLQGPQVATRELLSDILDTLGACSPLSSTRSILNRMNASHCTSSPWLQQQKISTPTITTPGAA